MRLKPQADDYRDGVEVHDFHATSRLGKKLQALHVLHLVACVLAILGIVAAVTVFVPSTWVVTGAATLVVVGSEGATIRRSGTPDEAVALREVVATLMR